MPIIAIERIDGGVSIMQMADGVDLAGEVEKWRQATGSSPVGVRDISGAVLPTRAFRAAWRADEIGGVGIDMDHARAIHQARLDEAASLALADMANAQQQAEARGDTTEATQVAADRQRLQVAVDAVDLSRHTTPEDLLADWPEELSAYRGVL